MYNIRNRERENRKLKLIKGKNGTKMQPQFSLSLKKRGMVRCSAIRKLNFLSTDYWIRPVLKLRQLLNSECNQNTLVRRRVQGMVARRYKHENTE